jgi:hypothetical protein
MKHLLLSLIFLLSTTAFAAGPQSVRWTLFEDRQADLAHLVSVVNQKTGLNLATTDFLSVEKTPLATSQFQMFAQTTAGIPIHGRLLRVWTDLKTGEVVQVEALVEAPQRNLMPPAKIMASHESNKLITSEIMKDSRDPVMQSLKTTDMWENGELVRFAKVKGKHGVHMIKISLKSNRVIGHTYEEFPQVDQNTDAEITVPAVVYPFYEQAETVPQVQPRVNVELKHINQSVPRFNGNPYQALEAQRYLSPFLDGILAETPQGQAQGYWSMDVVKRNANKVLASLPRRENSFASGLILDGKYATINLHPDAIKFPGISFKPAASAQLRYDWNVVDFQGQQVYEMVPRGGLLGKPLTSLGEAASRPARRLPDHNPTEYINDGFDELQVYYAINTLVESLHDNGFLDPELSTRPFNAFLFDPDIEMRNNAYYTDDTINFTTYSPDQPNYARDNITIWHELGHGIMDRLMGSSIELADTGGLSEGMADFVSAMVTANVTDGAPFPGSQDRRIINNTGFFLTNEVHDDGEAYGGTMKDILDGAMAQYGHDGVVKVTDLTLETMRLTRNFPGLTANDWFNHMLFADQVGSLKIRNPGELHSLILKALAGRNFSLENAPVASAALYLGTTEVTGYSAGSRRQPIRLSLAPTEKASYDVTLQPKGTATYKFQYPLTVKALFNKGPLQGGVHWEGEENGPLVQVLKNEQDVAKFHLSAIGKCDEVNQGDGSCKDYVYLQVFNSGNDLKPVAKKRFYLQIKTK